MFRRMFRHGGPHGQRHHERHEHRERHEGHGHDGERRERHERRGHAEFGQHAGHQRPHWRWFMPRERGPGGRGPFSFGPGGGRPPFGNEGSGRRRHRRGDIKIALLELLAEQPRHGYDLIKALENRYGGFYRPSPGSVYPTLQLLEDEGHLTSEVVDGKRTYSITDSGRSLLAEQPSREDRQHGSRGMHEVRPELDQLRANVEALLASVAQVAQHGTPEQAQAVAGLLESNRKAIYRILAGDEQGSEA
jgi:DNA-binding PadR family transcriptional regulator